MHATTQTAAAPAANATRPLPPLDEYYRALYRNLCCAYQGAAAPLQAVGITSCTAGEGVTTTAIQLAVHAVAEIARPVLLIDASHSQGTAAMLLERGAAAEHATRRSRAGAANVLPSTVDNLHVLPQGNRLPRIGANGRMHVGDVIEQLKQEYPFIVVDLPTACEMSDCFELVAALDGVALVVEAERTRGQVARYGKDQLLQAKANLLGVVLNKHRHHVPEWLYRRL